jgi:hypothetical protein
MNSRKARLIPLLLLVMSAAACGADTALLSPPERLGIQQLRAGTHRLVVASEALPTGRYQHFDRGTRTYRFDTSTGQICIMLTELYDWDSDEAKKQACK